MDKQLERDLLRLRSDMVNKAVMTSRLKEMLLKYYPVGTKLIITKDYYRIEEPKTEKNEV